MDKKGKMKKPTVKQRLKKISRDLATAKSRYEREALKVFGSLIKQTFKKHKSLEKISWRQYTPSWNDGDVCSFGCYFDPVAVNEEDSADPQSVYELERILDLFKNREGEIKRIMHDMKGMKDGWELTRLKHDLEILKDGSPEEIREIRDIKASLSEILGDFEETFFEGVFGEGVVTINRDGSSNVEPCDHD